MLQYLLISLLTLTASNNPDLKLNCADFKTGKFSLMGEESKKTYFIKRDDKFQKETDDETGISNVFRINWTGKCTYTLAFESGQDEVRDFYNGRKLFVEIVEIKGKTYKYDSYVEGMKDVVYSGWVKKAD